MGRDKDWEIREATPQDRAAIEDLCKEAVGPDDYVLDFLDYLITRATTLLAWKDGKAIGMLTYHPLMDGSGWISSARTRREHRQQGVTRSLVESFVVLGRSRGAKALRMWSESDNTDGRIAFTRTGFTEVGRFSRRIAPASKRASSSHPELTGYSEGLWREVEASEVLRKSSFYVARGFGFVKVTRPVIKHFADENTLFTWKKLGATLAEEMSYGRDMLDAQPLFGDARTIIRELPGIAKAHHLTHVETFFPRDNGLLEFASKHGYELGDWAKEAVLFERPI